MTLQQPDPKMQMLIRKQLNENVSRTQNDLQHIKEWLAKQPHLPQFEDDQRITTFLRGCKFSLEKTKRKLDMYFTMRAVIPDFFNDRDVTRPELKEILGFLQMPPLPGLTPNGCRVIVMRCKVDNPSLTYNVIDVLKLVFMIGDIRLKEEHVGVAGDVYILDASRATPAQFAKYTPTVLKKFFVCIQYFSFCANEMAAQNTTNSTGKLRSLISSLRKKFTPDLEVTEAVHGWTAANEVLTKGLETNLLPPSSGPCQSVVILKDDRIWH